MQQLLKDLGTYQGVAHINFSVPNAPRICRGGTYSGVLMQVNVIYYTPKPNVVYIPAIKGETRNLHLTRFSIPKLIINPAV